MSYSTRAISIHAPREGGDGSRSAGRAARTDFNPRPPRGERLVSVGGFQHPFLFQSTPPARGATSTFMAFSTSAMISIHAPREGGDQ